MTHVAAAEEGEVRLVALVRGPDGKPKFDDPHNVHPDILGMLTADDLEHLQVLKTAAEV